MNSLADCCLFILQTRISTNELKIQDCHLTYIPRVVPVLLTLLLKYPEVSTFFSCSSLDLILFHVPKVRVEHMSVIADEEYENNNNGLYTVQ